MELKVDRPALAGQNIDPATFQRVWDRVMPEQAAENTSIPDTAVPAVPTQPAEEQPPASAPLAAANLPAVPDCPALSPVPDCPSMPTVPDCPASPDQPDCPALPAVPDCPPDSQCPACPECSACPESPRTLGAVSAARTAPVPETPAFCLGEASQGDAARLEALMTLAQSGAAAARPMGGAGAREHETMRITPGCPTVLATMDADTGCPGHDFKHVLDLPAAV